MEPDPISTSGHNERLSEWDHQFLATSMMVQGVANKVQCLQKKDSLHQE